MVDRYIVMCQAFPGNLCVRHSTEPRHKLLETSVLYTLCSDCGAIVGDAATQAHPVKQVSVELCVFRIAVAAGYSYPRDGHPRADDMDSKL